MGSWRSRATQSDAKGVHSQGPGSGSPGQSPARERQFRNMVAEREGFEPSVHLLGVHTISSRAPSASRTSLPNNLFILHDDPPGTGSHSLWPLFARGGGSSPPPGRRFDNGGEGGIRTHVPCSSQDKSISSRPRYGHFGTSPFVQGFPSRRRSRKNFFNNSEHSAIRIPPITST